MKLTETAAGTCLIYTNDLGCERGYCKMGFRWLHISDLHIDSATSSARGRSLDRCVEFASHYCNKLDAVFVTGDVGNQGSPSSYANASVFFDKLLNALNLTQRELFVVPGNHDFQREAMTSGLKPTLNTIEESDRYFGGTRRFHYDGLQSFRDWYDDYFSGIRKFDDSTTCPIEVFPTAEGEVAIILGNTTLFSGIQETHGKLWLGLPCMHDALSSNQVKEAWLRVLLLHHPIEHLHFEERTRLPGMLLDKIHLVLFGHTHQTDTSADPFGSSAPISIPIKIGAGSTPESRQEVAILGSVVSGRLHLEAATVHPRTGAWEIYQDFFGKENELEILRATAKKDSRATLGPDKGIYKTLYKTLVPKGRYIRVASSVTAPVYFKVDSVYHMTIGREGDIRIPDSHASVSREHAEIAFEKDLLSIKDLGSQTGTFLAGAKLDARTATPFPVGKSFFVDEIEFTTSWSQTQRSNPTVPNMAVTKVVHYQSPLQTVVPPAATASEPTIDTQAAKVLPDTETAKVLSDTETAQAPLDIGAGKTPPKETKSASISDNNTSPRPDVSKHSPDNEQDSDSKASIEETTNTQRPSRGQVAVIAALVIAMTVFIGAASYKLVNKKTEPGAVVGPGSDAQKEMRGTTPTPTPTPEIPSDRVKPREGSETDAGGSESGQDGSPTDTSLNDSDSDSSETGSDSSETDSDSSETDSDSSETDSDFTLEERGKRLWIDSHVEGFLLPDAEMGRVDIHNFGHSVRVKFTNGDRCIIAFSSRGVPRVLKNCESDGSFTIRIRCYDDGRVCEGKNVERGITVKLAR